MESCALPGSLPPTGTPGELIPDHILPPASTAPPATAAAPSSTQLRLNFVAADDARFTAPFTSTPIFEEEGDPDDEDELAIPRAVSRFLDIEAPVSHDDEREAPISGRRKHKILKNPAVAPLKKPRKHK
jgi:hypothetical protein